MNKAEIINDYKIAIQSRQMSLLGRKEVLTGKAKFGIFGDGKEVAQLALAKYFREGDWRSGYYRDQTLMLASGIITMEEFFAQLYGDTDITANPANGGRMMNNHFATRYLDESGNWLNQTLSKNSSADISPTAGQMPRLLGLALASKLYKNNKQLSANNNFSKQGNEIAFGTIGDSSTSEGVFWETMNAAGVLQVPLVMSVWDDGWGISVPAKYQTIKQSISEALQGFAKTKTKDGIMIFTARGWNYPELIETYKEATKIVREQHIPALVHVTELTQPQGHSTSGSHERYKTTEQLKWESDFDCIKKMKAWILHEKIANEKELQSIENEAIDEVKQAKTNAWKHFQNPIKEKRSELVQLVSQKICACPKDALIKQELKELEQIAEPIYKDIISAGKKILRNFCNSCESSKPLKQNLTKWLNREISFNENKYSSHLYSESSQKASNIKEIKPIYSENSPWVNGREILRDNFDYIFSNNAQVVAFGEDVGKIGGVNQTYEGLQSKYGEHRIFDTGIREATIIGQGLGLAMRGFRPITEIQYFDYLLYGLQVVSDDLATLQYRTKGGQKAPMIISTRGHRLEGIWHSGSALSMVINSIRGVNVLVPRNMTQAAGFYNTMLQSDEPALIIEPLNAYRLKEKMPDNIGKYTIPLGKPEILNEGTDITLVTYGSCVRIAQDAIEQLNQFHISVELIDVQTLIPFDTQQIIAQSIQKTNKVLFFDEDVPGGTTAYMLKKVIEDHNAFHHLDMSPKTLSAKDHRPAYSTDGDYFSNPSAEDVFDTIYAMMSEYNPAKFPNIYK